MKELSKLAFAFLMLVTFHSYGQDFSELFDDRDGKTYKTIQLGNQIWMAENLKFWVEKDSPYYVGVSHFYDGSNQNYTLHGRLYPWEVAIKACPEGWHLPSIEEWIGMINSFGNLFDENHRIPTKKQSSKAEVKRRKALYKEIFQALQIDGSSGFNVSYGGSRDPNTFQGVSLSTMRSYYSGLGTIGRYWSADDDIQKGMFKKLKAKVFIFTKWGKSFGYQPIRKSIGCSVRCVKNDENPKK